MAEIFIIWDKNYNKFIDLIYYNLRANEDPGNVTLHAFTSSNMVEKDKPRLEPWIFEHECLTETPDGPDANLIAFIMRNYVKFQEQKDTNEGIPRKRKLCILVQTKAGQHEEFQMILNGISEFASFNIAKLYQLGDNFYGEDSSRHTNRRSREKKSDSAQYLTEGDFIVRAERLASNNDADRTNDQSFKRSRYHPANSYSSADERFISAHKEHDISLKDQALCDKCIRGLGNFFNKYDEEELQRRSWPSTKRGNQQGSSSVKMCRMCMDFIYKQQSQIDVLDITRRLENQKQRSALNEVPLISDVAKPESTEPRNCVLCTQHNPQRENLNYRHHEYHLKSDCKCKCDETPFLCTNCFLRSIGNSRRTKLKRQTASEKLQTQTEILEKHGESPRPGSAPAKLLPHSRKNLCNSREKHTDVSTKMPLEKSTLDNTLEAQNQHKDIDKQSDIGFERIFNNSSQSLLEDTKESSLTREEGSMKLDDRSFKDSLDELLARLDNKSSVELSVSEKDQTSEEIFGSRDINLHNQNRSNNANDNLTGKSNGLASTYEYEALNETEANQTELESKLLVNAFVEREEEKVEAKTNMNISSSSFDKNQSGIVLATYKSDINPFDSGSYDEKVMDVTSLNLNTKTNSNFDYDIFNTLDEQADYEDVTNKMKKQTKGKKTESELDGKNGQYHCKFCPDKIFSSLHVWRIHMKNMHKKCNCPCGKYFETRDEYLKHFYTLFPLACFLERKCPERFRSLYFQAVHHRDRHFSERPFFCVLCFGVDEDQESRRRASFKDIKALRIHAESMGHDPGEMFLISSKMEQDSSSLPWSMKCSGINFC